MRNDLAKPRAQLVNRSVPTIKKIAEAAGVHTSTVSRALDPNKRHMMSKEVAERIISRAEELGYRPNRLAAGLRRGRSNLIGVLVPDMANPVFAPILAGIAEVLSSESYATVVADAGSAPASQISFVETLLSQRVEGLILATAQQNDELVGFCVQRGLPVILVNRTETRKRASSVVSDDHLGMDLAVEHLSGLGHRRIGHLAGPLSTSTGALRLEGFERAVTQRGIAGFVRETSAYTRDAGRAAALSLLEGEQGVTAFVAANDLLALGALDAFKEKGLRCPDDVSLVGHNDMPFMDVIAPPLTTVRIEHRQMGREAARMLVEAIRCRPEDSSHLVLRPLLVNRSSTAPAPAFRAQT